MRIPNIVHFVFGLEKQTQEFLFAYFLAVYSCELVNKPKKIFFHYHFEPFGRWWDALKKIPSVRLIKIHVPRYIGKHRITKLAHRADKVRMELLWKKGGVYMDIDTISVRPYTHLLNNNVVLGIEAKGKICNAIMMSAPRSQFFRIWREEYRKYFNPQGWGEASLLLPLKIAKKNPNLLRLENRYTFFYPSWDMVDMIFSIDNKIDDRLLALHLWETKSLPYLEKIRSFRWCRENPKVLYARILLKLNKDYQLKRNIKSLLTLQNYHDTLNHKKTKVIIFKSN